MRRHSPGGQVKSRPARILPAFWQSFNSSTRTSALLVATGIGLTAVIPAYATRIHPAMQQISQASRPVEVTLVTYAVTKAAYDKIIPLFTEKWRSSKTRNRDYAGCIWRST